MHYLYLLYMHTCPLFFCLQSCADLHQSALKITADVYFSVCPKDGSATQSSGAAPLIVFSLLFWGPELSSVGFNLFHHSILQLI